MRSLALIVLAAFCLISVGCAVTLQPSVQGEWSNMHNDKHKVSMDARPHQETAAETK